jgi:hypothetical protein
MRRAKNLAKSSEEKVAHKIGQELTDFSLDLEAVGLYLSRQPHIIYNRAIEVLEATEYNRNNEYNDKWKEYRDEQDTL